MKAEEKARIIKAVRDYTIEHDIELWHDPENVAYATVPVSGGGFNHHKIRSRDFKLLVHRVLFKHMGGPPPPAVVRDTITDLESWAIVGKTEYPTYVRIAPSESGGILIDLADRARHVCAVNGTAFTLGRPPVPKFLRTKGIADLPFPAEGEHKLALHQFMNIGPQHQLLFYTWLTNCLRPNGPYPVLVLSGVQGSGKSTLTKIARLMVDPSIAPLTGLYGSSEDLTLAANNSHLLAFDNVSKISARLSDDLCRIATGAAMRARKRWTADEELFHKFCKPVLINGIENLVLRGDLLDRSILIHMEPISAQARQTEADFWNDFREIQSEQLGALYRAVGAAMATLELIHVEDPPRMADFARWGVAIEWVLGYPKGQFLRDYAVNRADAGALAIEASPIFTVVRDYLTEHDRFSGTARRLLQTLTKYAEANAKDRQKGVMQHPEWPKSPAQLSGALRRIEPILATEGIKVVHARNGNDRFIKLAKEQQ